MSTFSQYLPQDRRQNTSRRACDRGEHRHARRIRRWPAAGRALAAVLRLAALGLLLSIGWLAYESWQQQCCRAPLEGVSPAAAVPPLTLPGVPSEPAPQFDCRRLVEGLQVMFAPASSVLAEADKRQIDQIMDRCLKGGQIEVGGHTDSDGTPLANQRISVARASAVVDYLISRGMPASSLAAIGYGAMRPVADNATEAGRAMNRRITFVRR